MSSSQAVLKLIPQPPEDVRISRSRFELNACPRVLRAEPCHPSRNGNLPFTVPAFSPPNKPTTDIPQDHILQGLRAHLRTMDGAIDSKNSGAARVKSPWQLGARELDSLIGPQGLHPFSVHEIKPCEPIKGTTAAGSLATAIGFALRLSARRLLSLRAHDNDGIQNHNNSSNDQSPSILWCTSSQFITEVGNLYGPGLCALGFHPSQVLIVETHKNPDLLWAIEEGLRSKTQALVIGCLSDVALTPARRLSLAAQKYKTPCLLLTDARTPGAAATATRWRIAPITSAPHPLAPEIPGAARYQVLLERQRNGFGQTYPMILEWCNETHRFGVVSGMADRTDAAREQTRTKYG